MALYKSNLTLLGFFPSADCWLLRAGPLPEIYGAFTLLEKLLLSENHLTGTLPDIGADWSNMKELWAEYNNFKVHTTV